MDQLTEAQGLALEKNYVKSTYDNIADGFSDTRYKKWPKVKAFTENLATFALMLDIGCGNGKYLDNPGSINIGCDISLNLLSICKKRGFEVVLCDMTRLPFREHSFDAIICIAAIHHIVTAKRRQECIESMINLLYSSSSRLLIQVWSYEQDIDNNNPYLKEKSKLKDSDPTDRKEMCIEGEVKISVHKNRTPFIDQDLLVPFKLKQTTEAKNSACDDTKEYLRYYHLFKAGELDSLIQQISNVKIQESYHDKGNWCSIVSR